MDTDLDTLATALYVTTDDLLRAHPERVPARPKGSFEPLTSDAEMLTLAVMQAVLGYPSEARWLRYAHRHLRPLFPALPLQPGYNKRLRKLAPTMSWLFRQLAGQASVATDDVWVVDSTPVDCARSRETVKRSDPGRVGAVRLLRLALTVLLGVATAPGRHRAGTAHRLGPDRCQSRRTRGPDRALGQHRDAIQLLIADKNYYGRAFEAELQDGGIDLLRKARKGEPPRPGGPVLQTAAPGRGVRLRHRQRTTRRRTTPRQNTLRRRNSCCPARSSPDRHHLAQRPRQRSRPTLTDRLRPLTPGNHSSRPDRPMGIETTRRVGPTVPVPDRDQPVPARVVRAARIRPPVPDLGPAAREEAVTC